MKAVNSEALFNAQIDARLKSDAWNREVARNVYRQRRKTRYRTGVSGLIGSLAAAALIALFLTTGIQEGSREGDELNALVNAQVEGTWNRVFADTRVPESDDTLDALIDDTLAERL